MARPNSWWSVILSPILAVLLTILPVLSNAEVDQVSPAKTFTEPAPVAEPVAAPEPMAAPAPMENTQDARADAIQDANADVSKGAWIAAGILCGVFGWLFSFLSNSKPPASRLVGKSADYATVYSTEYEHKAKSLKSNNSIIGCLIGIPIGLFVQLAIIGAQK